MFYCHEHKTSARDVGLSVDGRTDGRRFRLMAVAAALMLAGAVSAPAATYYVSQSDGNDTWSGLSPATPWKTLARASTNYVAGDRLLLKRGDTWQNDKLYPRGSGTPENPIEISSSTGGRTTFGISAT